MLILMFLLHLIVYSDRWEEHLTHAHVYDNFGRLSP